MPTSAIPRIAKRTVEDLPVQGKKVLVTPEDVIQMVPVLGKIPRSFLFSDGTTLKFSTNQLRFDHRGRRRAGSELQRTCLIGLSYTAAVGGSFSSEVHVPLFQSPS